MNIKKYISFLSKEGYDIEGPIVRSMIKPLKKFLKLNNKGNPVPSINDVFDWMDRNRDYEKKSFFCPIHKKKTVMLDSLFLMLDKIREYGVETNNEQPEYEEDDYLG